MAKDENFFQKCWKPNSLLKNWHTSLFIISDSRNSVWSLQLCQSPVDCAISVVKNEDSWFLIKTMKSAAVLFFVYNSIQTDLY